MTTAVINIIGFVGFFVMARYVVKQFSIYAEDRREEEQARIAKRESKRKSNGPKFLTRSLLAMLTYFVLMLLLAVVIGLITQ